nr:retrovirus-related Pol polyprotein from transposon TNT 1-94 [Tanacetum cinerariifolium]
MMTHCHHHTEEQIQEENSERWHRKKETSIRLRDYVTNTVKKTSPSLSTLPAQSRSSEKEPVTYYEAITDKRWRSAMDSELEALERNQTWTIKELPSNKKALGCKWVYIIKYKSDGTIERFKARLVILGNHQVDGIDYTETIAPIEKMVTVRVFLAVATSKQWELHQMYLHNAFLHGDLEEKVFMKIPPGLNKGKPGEACKLRKSLYGLQQAPRCNLKYFLGARAQDGIFLCQQKYALDIICEAGLLGAKPSKIPMEQNRRLGLAKGRLFEDPEQYRRLAIETEKEPVTYYEAITDKRWRSAMDSELEALERNQTWTIEELPSNKKALGCKWVYIIKYKSDGTIERFKARLVILGNHQVDGIDYTETIAPIEKMVTVRVFLAVATSKQWELHQMYLHNAFLHGDLEEKVFMKIPPGLNKGKPGEACKLRKSLYGLQQAPRSGLLGAKPSKIPMEQNRRLGLAKGRLFEDPEQYRRLFMQNPQIEHCEAAIRVVRFLKRSPGQVFHERTKHIEVDCHYIDCFKKS